MRQIQEIDSGLKVCRNGLVAVYQQGGGRGKWVGDWITSPMCECAAGPRRGDQGHGRTVAKFQFVALGSCVACMGGLLVQREAIFFRTVGSDYFSGVGQENRCA